MPRPRIVGGPDPEPPDPIALLAPLAGTPPYTRRWFRLFGRLLRATFVDAYRDAERKSP
jgi:hypothetical protein